ncbi:hypothetical protein Patl1_35925 [Pistacia atlantica]|nr:hypothetical protein Patl1_35925 [Pistacia atlantica]
MSVQHTSPFHRFKLTLYSLAFDSVVSDFRINSSGDTVFHVPVRVCLVSVYFLRDTVPSFLFNGFAFWCLQLNGGSLVGDLWKSREGKFYYGCSTPSEKFQPAEVKTQPNRYLLIVNSGGLNQQRTGITDAVVAAYILNTTLVIPKLDQKSYWKDTSDFGEIFDVDWFISFLSRDVEIIKQLPIKRGKVLTPHNMRAVQLTKFDYRLSNNLDSDLQKLRCRVNYHALRFTDSILEMGKLLVERMRMKSKHFIAMHLRFQSDMLAFSGCYYGGGEKEKTELGAIRKRWKRLHVSNPDRERRNGRCPLTPEEVGLMLRALGFGSDAHLYVASGEVYGGEETLAPLKAMFPNLHSKETLASKTELEMFSSFSSRMAALDFIFCDESDVFVTNNNGNMARILAGRRVRTHQIGFMGEPNQGKPGGGEFHENPTSCICEDSKFKARQLLTSRSQTLDNNHKAREDHSNEKEQDWFEMDYGENGHPNHSKEFST